MQLNLAQNQENTYNYSNTELSIVLKQLEQKFGVKFSYNPEWIEEIKINLNIVNPTLNQFLVEFQRQLHFSFEKIDDRYIVIKPISEVYICGYLKNSINKKPIENANVNTFSGSKYATTSTKGYFQLSNVPINDSILISSLGFKSKKLAVKSFYKKCNDLYLEEKLYTLNEVVIKEYLSSGISLKNDGTVLFDLKKTDILAGQAEPDVLQSIQLLPGVDNVSENASDILIRGGTTDQNLILWDDIKLYNTDHFFGTLTNLNSNIINNVTVYKSGTSAKYGNSVSGVVDIRLDENIPKKIITSFGFNSLSSDFALKIPIHKKLGLIVSGRRSLIDVLKTQAFDNNFFRIFQNSRLKINREAFPLNTASDESSRSIVFEDYSAKLIFQLSEAHKLKSTLLYTNNDLRDVFNAVTGETFDGDLLTDNFFDFLSIENLGTSFFLESKWTNRIKTKIGGNYSNYSLNYVGLSFNPLFFAPVELERFNEIDDASGYFNVNYQWNSSVGISSGYELTSKRINYRILEGIFGDFNQRYNNKPGHSFYSQLTYNKSENLHVDFGIRVNKFANFERLRFEPRLFVEKKIHKKLRIKGSAEQKNQDINRIEILSGNDTGEETEVWFPSNDSIPLVNSKQVSLGAVFKNKNWIVDIDAYYKKLKGITAFNGSFVNVFNQPNEGEGKIKGVDFLLKKKINKFSIWLGYTFSENEQIFESLNNGKPFNSSNDVTHSFTVSNFLEWKRIQFSLGWKYRTGTPFTVIKDFDDILAPTIETLNGERLPDFHRLDFSANYSIPLSKRENNQSVKIGLSIQNLYDRRNIQNINFTDRQINIDDSKIQLDQVKEIKTTSLGITPNFFLRLNF
ncbi:TonB-dependent receptor domain-containing protein [Aquimarina agarivorans]|uniref:TonB-dependent receptor domain-containing protein n=1 Tax=Aquimarina agarivorans TaxID=980584 RepID=UPI000248E78C|nr:TonB-dependent receptor [Aquimarina agarivorans]